MATNGKLDPTVPVTFGGEGDLTWRKLVPSLFDLSQDRSTPSEFRIVAPDARWLIRRCCYVRCIDGGSAGPICPLQNRR
jgi:hypothetical protein